MENTYSKKEIELMTENIKQKLDEVIEHSDRMHKETRGMIKNLNTKVSLQGEKVNENDKKLLFATEELKEHSILLSNLTGQVLAYKTDREKEKDEFIKSLRDQLSMREAGDKKWVKWAIGVGFAGFLYVLIKVGAISKDFVEFIF